MHVSGMAHIPTYDWISLGGGAAGYFGAINYALNHRGQTHSAKIAILERSGKSLAKVKISGGGRCNVMHAKFDVRELINFYPRGRQALRSVFHRFGPQHTQAWFSDQGVALKVEDDGRMFPVTDSSQTIIDCFGNLQKQLGIELHYHQAMVKCEWHEGLWHVHTANNTLWRTKYLLLATGSNVAAWHTYQALGIKTVPPVPSLFSFNIDHPVFTSLAGISFSDVEVRLKASPQSFKTGGPMLITHWGLSGPAILKMSAWAARACHALGYRVPLEISFLPQHHDDSLAAYFKQWQQKHRTSMLLNARPDELPKRFFVALLHHLDIDPKVRWADLGKAKVRNLIRALLHFSCTAQGKTTYKEEFVTAGGIDCDEIDFRSMQVKKYPGLYVAGEVVDIDGVTGGFNFQAAWATSYIAAHHACQSRASNR